MITSTRFRRLVLAAVPVFCFAIGLRGAAAAEISTAPAKKVREPAVADLFYPKDPAELSRVIDACLAAAKVVPADGELKALICPHAGYPYSGPVAASAYRLLAGRDFQTVVVMGPSHYADLHAASVANADLFRTPLGDVPISGKKARKLAKLSPFALEPHCFVQRPSWWQSSRPAPDEDTADTWEHSVEVEIPFLQRTLKSFGLVPVVCGQIDEAKAALALMKILDDRTLIIASSDLSHYDTYANAQERDRRCIEAICRLDPDAVGNEDACGHTPIRILLHVAKQLGWQARLLDYRNSGDTTGDKSRGVVGYAAIAFYAPAATSITAPATAQFTTADRRYLLGLARKSVLEAAASGQVPEVSADKLAPKFTAAKGCFVTLTTHGVLRGCIGYILPHGPLYRAVVENARNAAIRDPRFPAVKPGEVDQINIEISVLTEPLPLSFSSPEDLLNKLRPGVDGVVLQIGSREATYLPQVWEQIPGKVDFLNNLAEKAGCEPSAWRQSGTAVFIYHVESFKEPAK
ncbi:MAG: AmmeMemoRadiSam system protein B [Verrucomicrobia bacterium]|nr:AmmeMemoRadiSam system protein B [Verrucomicrobiota bacterium]